MKKLLNLVEEFRESLVSGDVSLQESIFQELDLVVSDYSSVAQNVFEALLQLLKDEAIQKSVDSARIFKFFEYNYDLLNSDQKRVLCETFETIYPHYIDPSSLILMLEQLVDIGENELHKIEVFAQYQQLNSSPAKVLLPYGLKYLYKHTKNPEILSRCKKITKYLTKDKDEDVRKEAARTIDYYKVS